MRVVFLDIDGVLLPWDAACPPEGCVAALTEILRRTGAVVVISSSWRERQTLVELEQWLVGVGVHADVVGATPVLVGARRGAEIGRWLDSHPDVTAFVILDDCAAVEPYQDRLVLTDEYHGLGPRHVELACAILGRRSDG